MTDNELDLETEPESEKNYKNSLEEELYLHLDGWKGTSSMILLCFFGFFCVVVGLGMFPFEGYEDAIAIVFFAAIGISIVKWNWQRKKSRNIQNQYERRQYFLILSTMEGEGKNTLEKFMDIAIRVFPPLKKEAQKHAFKKDWWLDETKREDAGENKYDIITSHRIGFAKVWFVVKRFDKTVTFDDITNVWMKDKREQDRRPIRIVIIAKDYDPKFFTNELDEKMKDLLFYQKRERSKRSEKTITNLKKKNKYEKMRTERMNNPDKIGIDLLIEKEYGFTPLWLH